MKEEIIRLYSEGMSYTQIQKLLGCSKGTIAYHCGPGQKVKTLNRQRDRRGKIVKYIQQHKQDNPCVDCGENYPYWMMQFDHLSDKVFQISRNRQHTFEEVVKEMNKCELVCANCHANRTHTRSINSLSNSLDVSGLY